MANHIACGGTFDLFHKGHKDFLTKALDSANQLTVGVAGDKLAETLDKSPFDSLRLRMQNVENFIKNTSSGKKFDVLVLNDIFGTTISDDSIDAILVTENTYDGAVKINRRRAETNIKPLEVLTVSMSLASDGKPISTTRINKGEISPEGMNYLQHLTRFSKYKLTDDLRKKLARPQGLLYANLKKIIDNNFSSERLISVGDQITHNLLSAGIIPAVSIVDFKVERRRKFRSLADLGFANNENYFMAKNPPSFITFDLVDKIDKIFRSGFATRVLFVDGEEDLSVLPVTLLSPLGCLVVYGQRDQGVVAIKVDLELKERFLSIFDSFEKIRLC